MSNHYPDKPLIGDQLTGVRWLYFSDFYDGPRSGMVALEDGTQAWADLAAECTCYSEDLDQGQLCGWYRRYQLYRLTDDAFTAEAERHADFQHWVGTHMDAGGGGTQHRDNWQRFYDKYPPDSAEPRLDGATPIGWFVP